MKLPINQVIQGDCLEVMKTFPDKSIDLVLTDPPYGMNYGKVKGDEDISLFLNSMPLIYKVLKDNTFYITYFSPKFIKEIILKAESCGFNYKWIGFNYYPNMFKQKPQPLGYNRYDSFITFSKGNAKKSAFMKDVVHIVMDKKKPSHIHGKPKKAIDKLIKCASKEGDIVLDPFCGNGTMLVSAKQQKRNYIGIEIEPEYCEISNNWLKEDLSLLELEI